MMIDKALIETKVVWIGDDKLQHFSLKCYKQEGSIHFFKQKFQTDKDVKSRLIPITEPEEISVEEYSKYKSGQTI